MIWKALVYAKTPKDFDDAWLFILEEFPEQEAAIQYIKETWMPWRQQFAHCWIQQNRNWGLRVTSRTEASHREIKSYLLNSTADLKFLADRVEQMVKNNQARYIKMESDEAARQIQDYRTRHWMGDCRHKCSRFSLNLLLTQYRLAVSVRQGKRLATECTGNFKRQYGVPCSHELYTRSEGANPEPLTYLDLHPHWHLGRDLAAEDKIRAILDPLVVLTSRGRPRIAPEEIPVGLIPRGSNLRRQGPETRARDPSYWEIVDAQGRVRQDEVATQFLQNHEADGRTASQQTQEEAEESTQTHGRGRGQPAPATSTPRGRGRGRGPRGTRARRITERQQGHGRERGQQNMVEPSQGGTGARSSTIIQLGTPVPDTPIEN